MKVDRSLRLYSFSTILLTFLIFASALVLIISVEKFQGSLVELHFEHSKEIGDLEATTSAVGAVGALALVLGVLFFILLSRALTKARTMGELLTVSEDLSQQATHIAGLGLFDRDYRVPGIFISERLREICGWSPEEEITFLKWGNTIHPEDRPKVLEAIERSKDPQGSGTYEYEHRVLVNEKTKWVHVVARTYFVNNIPVRTRGVVSDITEMKEREVALARSKAFIQKVLGVSPTIVAILELDSLKVNFASQSITRALGYESSEIEALESIMQITHPDDIDQAEKFYESLVDLPDEAVAENTRRLRHKNGEWIYIFSRIACFSRDSNGRVSQIISAGTDITSLKELEHKLEKSNRDLEQFAGIAAHDLTAPLKSMHSWIDVLDESVPCPRPAQAEEAIEFIRKTSERADSMVRSLLELARINSEAKFSEGIELNRLVDHLLGVLKLDIQNAGARVNIGNLPLIRGNSHVIESVFSNLIRNALVYRRCDRQAIISIGYEERDNNFEFFVKDNGIGIDRENLKTIFQMFKRLHGSDKYPGSGIGLAYCKRVVEICGGKIWVESQPGEGSTFYFTYPKHPKRLTA